MERKRLNNQAVWKVIFDVTGPILVSPEKVSRTCDLAESPFRCTFPTTRLVLSRWRGGRCAYPSENRCLQICLVPIVTREKERRIKCYRGLRLSGCALQSASDTQVLPKIVTNMRHRLYQTQARLSRTSLRQRKLQATMLSCFITLTSFV